MSRDGAYPSDLQESIMSTFERYLTLWVTLCIIPMLMKIDFRALREVGKRWRGIGVHW